MKGKRKKPPSHPTEVVSPQAYQFGQWLYGRRQDLDVTLETLTKDANVDVATLCRLERGTQDPMRTQLGKLIAVAKAYRVDFRAILWRLGLIPKYW